MTFIDVIHFQIHFAGGEGIVTSISVGSLLDDNMWHDVYISRKSRDITFSVDRVVLPAKIRGDFSKLDLKREVSITR